MIPGDKDGWIGKLIITSFMTGEELVTCDILTLLVLRHYARGSFILRCYLIIMGAGVAQSV